MTARGLARALIVLAVGGAGLLLLTNNPVRRPRPAHAAFGITAGGLRLRAVRAGSGPTLVLLHGYGESLLAWRGVLDRLAGQADVIALDLPGFGLSSKPATGYATDAMTRTVLAAIDAMGVERVVLVGHSMGGAVAAAAALLAPSRVRALVLVDPAGVAAPNLASYATDSSGAAVRRAVAQYEALRTRFGPPHDSTWLGEPVTDRAYLPAADSAYRLSLAAVLQEFDWAYLTPARIKALAIPVLVLWGEFDPVLPLAQGRFLRDSLPEGRLLVIHRSWHRPHVERPAETAAAIRAFLADIGLEPASH